MVRRFERGMLGAETIGWVGFRKPCWAMWFGRICGVSIFSNCFRARVQIGLCKECLRLWKALLRRLSLKPWEPIIRSTGTGPTGAFWMLWKRGFMAMFGGLWVFRWTGSGGVRLLRLWI